MLPSCVSIDVQSDGSMASPPPPPAPSETALAVQKTLVISPDSVVTTLNDMVLNVVKSTSTATINYNTMFGPWPSGSGTASGQIVEPTGTWQVNTGYAFLWGIFPSGRTRRVVTAGQAATHIIHIVDSATDRIIYLSDTLPINATHQIVVNVAPGLQPAPGHPSSLTMSGPGYIEATDGPGGTVIISGPHALPADPADPIWQLIQGVEVRATAAGF